MRCSIVIAVLESYEAVRRQMLYFHNLYQKNPILKKTCRIILIDDGSDPSLYSYLQNSMAFDFRAEIKENPSNGCTSLIMGHLGVPLLIVETHDPTPWTQPRARNIGATYATGEYLLMTDIDHILTSEAIQAVLYFKGDRMLFSRKIAILDKDGEICRNRIVLMQYGYRQFNLENSDSHVNTFAIKRDVFLKQLKGYDERFCGRHGGDDTDFNHRYKILVQQGQVSPHTMGPLIYVFPDPRRDIEGIFHRLHRKQ